MKTFSIRLAIWSPTKIWWLNRVCSIHRCNFWNSIKIVFTPVNLYLFGWIFFYQTLALWQRVSVQYRNVADQLGHSFFFWNRKRIPLRNPPKNSGDWNAVSFFIKILSPDPFQIIEACFTVQVELFNLVRSLFNKQIQRSKISKQHLLKSHVWRCTLYIQHFA